MIALYDDDYDDGVILLFFFCVYVYVAVAAVEGVNNRY
jgi:hypothetical protein